jgi:hypothetical protein
MNDEQWRRQTIEAAYEIGLKDMRRGDATVKPITRERLAELEKMTAEILAKRTCQR